MNTDKDQSDVRDVRDVRDAAHRRPARLAGVTPKIWLHTGREPRTGPAVATITALAGRADADLIVLATHERTGLQHTFIGRVAERVVRYAPCSVQVVG